MSVALLPRTLDEAVGHLAEHPDLVLVAGCTDLMVTDAVGRARLDRVMSLLGVAELGGIREADGAVEIGAATPFSAIRDSALVRDRLPILAAVAAEIGGWQIQNRATIGGNVANASPAGDSLPVLLALAAEVEIAGPAGVRRLPYDDFHVGYRETVLAPGELLARVRIPLPAAGTVQAFRKVGTREAQAISKVVVAAAGRLEGGRLTALRLAAGSVAATPVRLTAAERAAIAAAGEGASAAEVAERAAAAARGEVTPIDDVRSTAEYRTWVLGRVVRRLVLETCRG